MNQNYILSNNTYIDLEKGIYYILCVNKCITTHGSIITRTDFITKFKQNNNIKKISEINLTQLYNYSRNIIDKYNIIKEPSIYTIGRILKIKYNTGIYIGIIYDIYKEKTEINQISILLSNGQNVVLDLPQSKKNLSPLFSEIEIQIDSIIEILEFYNLEALNIKLSNIF